LLGLPVFLARLDSAKENQALHFPVLDPFLDHYPFLELSHYLAQVQAHFQVRFLAQLQWVLSTQELQLVQL
jgi:hypothetical protein